MNVGSYPGYLADWGSKKKCEIIQITSHVYYEPQSRVQLKIIFVAYPIRNEDIGKFFFRRCSQKLAHKQRHRIQLAHKRNLVLREFFKEEIDVQSLEPRRDFDRQQQAKKRKGNNAGRKEKRRKVDSNEEGGKIRQDYMDED